LRDAPPMGSQHGRNRKPAARRQRQQGRSACAGKRVGYVSPRPAMAASASVRANNRQSASRTIWTRRRVLAFLALGPPGADIEYRIWDDYMDVPLGPHNKDRAGPSPVTARRSLGPADGVDCLDRIRCDETQAMKDSEAGVRKWLTRACSHLVIEPLRDVVGRED